LSTLELPGYRVVPVEGPGEATTQEVAGRGATGVRMVLMGTAAGWRIGDAWIDP